MRKKSEGKKGFFSFFLVAKFFFPPLIDAIVSNIFCISVSTNGLVECSYPFAK